MADPFSNMNSKVAAYVLSVFVMLFSNCVRKSADIEWREYASEVASEIIGHSVRMPVLSVCSPD